MNVKMDKSNNKTVIILGSSRSDGNTRKVVDRVISYNKDIDLIDLGNYRISYFDYDFNNQDDDFQLVIKRMLEYDQIIFATPVYWFSMSAPLKTFFDRISDLLHLHKEQGRKLRKKSMGMISCSSDNNLNDCFRAPFVESAKYLGMKYIGDMHSWLIDNEIPDEVNEIIKEFVLKINHTDKIISVN